MGVKYLVFLEYADEIALWQKWQKSKSISINDCAIVALEAETQVALKKLGIKHHNTLPFFGKDGHQRILQQSIPIMAHYRKYIHVEDSFGLSDGYQNAVMFYFRFFLLHCLYCMEIVSRAIAEFEPGAIVSLVGASPSIEPIMSKNNRPLGKMVALVAKEHQVKSVGFGQIAREKQSFLAIFLAKVVKKIAFLLFVKKSRILSNKKKLVLLLSNAYNLDSAASKMFDKKNGYVFCSLSKYSTTVVVKSFFSKKSLVSFGVPDFLFLINKSFIKQYRECLWDASDNRLAMKGSTVDCCINDFGEYIHGWFRRAGENVLCKQEAQTRYVARFIQQVTPAFVLAQMAVGYAYNLGELCRQYHVPNMLISHGSHTPPQSESTLIEWQEHGLGLINTAYQTIAVQTPWAQKYLEKVPSMHSSQLVTGPLILNRVQQCTLARSALMKSILPTVSEKKIIVHAGTPKLSRNIRTLVYETVDEYVQNINNLIAVISAIDQAYLVIRFRPLGELTLPVFKQLLKPSTCYQVCSEGTFADYLHLADLLVSYSSTTIEEALNSDVPVLQYDPDGKYCHVPAFLLTSNEPLRISSCYHVRQPENLGFAMNWILKNHLLGESEGRKDMFVEHIIDPNFHWESWLGNHEQKTNYRAK